MKGMFLKKCEIYYSKMSCGGLKISALHDEIREVI
jgi:hypothetical protein